MQYLYTLTSSPNDFFYEQFLLSAASLKYIMPNSNIVLLCDIKTKKTLIENRCEYEKIISKIITVEAPDNFNQIEVSRWVRTSMRRLVEGDFLFLDGDTIVTDDLSSIAEQAVKFSACLDKHSLIDKHAKNKNIIEMDKKLGFNSHLSNRHYNGGVLFCVDTPEVHKLFDRWHELWLFSKSKNIQRDQPSLNMAIHENSSLITELDGTWNCQISHNGLPYLANSKIIHYFATDLFMYSSPFLFASEKIFKQIKESGIIPNEAHDLLKNPRAAFLPESRIISGDDMLSVINSSFFQSIFLMKKKMPWLFNFFNCLCSAGKKITKIFIVKTSRKKNSGIKLYN